MSGSIIGIVGPNGSGKSNVSDAVRWVLGEQSAKSLRGGMMQDVIFAGTQARKPRSFCEVTLLFDNGDKRLGPEYTDIEVTRKLYRSGESEYFINGTKCRLKDILTLFRDTGVGREGYSIIGQGRIDEILSEKSLDRRRVFEEASGIMKYRVRKEEAERKLDKTRANMQRIGDILAEQSFMIEPLKKQAEDAAAYLEMAKRLRLLDVNMFLQNCEKMRDRISRLEQQRRELDEGHGEKVRRLEELAQILASSQEDVRRSEKDSSELTELLSKSIAELERVEGELKLCDERIQNNEKETQRIIDEISSAETKAAALLENEAGNQQRLTQIESELKKHRALINDAQNEIGRHTGITEEHERIMETVQNAKAESIERMSDVRSAVSALEQKRSSLKQRIEELQSRIEKAEEECFTSRETMKELEKDRQLTGERSAAMRNAFNEAIQRERELNTDIDAKRMEYESSQREYASCVSSIKMLADLKAGFEGYSSSVKKLMLAAKNREDIGKRILGTVADSMRVPAQFETAVEACLGGALQNIIVEDEYDAKHIIEYLRKNSMGRVTFLPVRSLRGRTLSEKERAALKEDGVYGVASELVSCGDSVKGAIDFLLARTLITDNADTAIRVMRLCSQSLRVVTVEGDVFNPGGSITGGSLRRESSGLVSRDRREDELRKRAEKLMREAARLKEALQEKAESHDALLKEIEDLRKALHEQEVAAAALREKQEALSAADKNGAERVEALKKELEDSIQSLSKAEQELSGFADLQDDMQHTSETQNEDYKRLEEERRSSLERIEELRNVIHDAEVSIAGLFRENAALINDNLRLGLDKQEHERTKASKEKTLALQKESAENLLIFRKELEETHQKRADVLETNRRRQSEMNTGRAVMIEKVTALETEMDQMRKAVNELSEKSLRTAFNIEKTQADIETAQNRLWDSYQITYAGALAERSDIDLSGGQTEAEEIRTKLHELGTVNPSAIDDYAALKERMEALATQKEDLSGAEQDLQKLIASLLNEMKRTFKQSFEQINKHFGATFKELFDGGRAELIMEDGDIMECGIEIVAEPPGKKLQKLSLLSGGEKALTAISLLFALLKINPSPVCILDEIDAALDEANVFKFSEYLEKYAQNVQFIVITHRKPTMAVCESLFGFAMEEKGVSKLLSVRLDKEGA